MKLSDVATMKTKFEDADFWITRRGSLKTVGKPVREYNPENIGIKIIRTDILLPDYLYYVFLHFYNSQMWEPLANGTLSLVNIRTADIRNIELSPR